MPRVSLQSTIGPWSGGSDKPATLADVGEKALLGHLLPMLGSDDRLLTGVGHDAAALALDRPASTLAFKIDRAARPVAFTRGWADASCWGRLAVTANCSDLLATGARPCAFMLSVTLPGDWSEQEYQRLVLGAKAECDAWNIVFAGGDTKEGAEPVVVGAAVGVLDGPPLSRWGASPGDALVASGPIGGFLGAYLLLENAVDALDEDRENWIRYLASPEAHWHAVDELATTSAIKAAVDTSDGVYDGIVELTREATGLTLDLGAIPWHPFAIRCAAELGLPLQNFLFAGGDWNLLFATAPQAGPDSPALHRIGTFTKDSALRAVDDSGRRFAFSGPRGEHFRHRLEDGRSFAMNVATGDWFVNAADGTS